MAHNQRKALYPSSWTDMRITTLARANWRCEVCGVKHHAELYSERTKQPYIVYLQCAHRAQYQTWNSQADTIALCPACHRRYDRQFRRKIKGFHMFTPIGYARVLIVDGGQAKLVDMARSYADLRTIVEALPDGALFEVILEIHQCAVGNGYYIKLPGDIQVESEAGACEGLWYQFRPV